MRKIAVLLCCALLLCGCGAKTEKPAKETSSVGVTVTLPQDDSVNGYRKSASPKQTDSGRYYANTNTMRFHIASCTYAKKIQAGNLLRTDDREMLIRAGYSPCKNCDP